jgi:alpha-amylase/alpha-mannosidase (GH57 family)
MHQPYYKDTVSGDYSLPWVRLHALKDYYHMAEIVAQHPAVHVTFNYVPSLLEQLREYAEGTAVDRCLAVSKREHWTPEEKAFMLSFFFSINWDNFVRQYPRYRQLLQLRNMADGEAELFGDAYYRDLAAWFNLIWIDRHLLESNDLLKRMVDKGRDFTHADILGILETQREIIGRIIPLYRKLEEAGQIEVTTSPFYHPILPLLTDVRLARESTPDAPLPVPPFAHPEDAVEQLRRAMRYHEAVFGQRPRGLWPSEGSVAQAIVPMLHDLDGLGWLATDEGILAQSLDKPVRRDQAGQVTNPDFLYRPYRLRVETDSGSKASHLNIIFRDVVLSDRIGFVYKNMPSGDAVQDLINRLHVVRKRLPADAEPYLVSIILDGENCWEEYENNGTPFLHKLYARLAEDPLLKPVTVSEHLEEYPATREIPDLYAGSWINHNFRTWIGERAQNRAWEHLARTRQWLVNWQRENPMADWATLEQAWEEIYIAEGSDWFWWYYSYNNPAGENLFDRDFRRHLRNVYRIAGVPSPSWLDTPITVQDIEEHERPATDYVTPELAAEQNPSEAWRGAAYVEAEVSTGTMQRSVAGVRRFYYGYDKENLYFRVEASEDLSDLFVGIYLSLPRGGKTNQRPRHNITNLNLELPTDGIHKEITIEGWVEPVTLNRAAGQEVWEQQGFLPAKVGVHVAEIRVPFAELDIELGDMLDIMCVVAQDGLITQILPPSGEATLALEKLDGKVA